MQLLRLLRLPQLKSVNLAANEIDALPDGLFAHNPELENVTLGSNKLGNHLTAKLFAHNKKLKTINLSQAWISQLPAGIFDGLTELELVHLYDNKLTSLDENIFSGNAKLRDVNLSDNPGLGRIPESAASSKELATFAVSNTGITELPKSLDGATKRRSLDASHNRISKVSDAVWKNIASSKQFGGIGADVKLSDNLISDVPSGVVATGKVHRLELAYNQLPEACPWTSDVASLMGVSLAEQDGYYPQRTALKNDAAARDGKVTLTPSGDIDLLDMYMWSSGSSSWSNEGFDMPIAQSKDAYLQYYRGNEKLKGMDSAKIMRDMKGLDWKIQYKVQKRSGDILQTICDKTVTSQADSSFEAEDRNMVEGDKYTITKTLYIVTAGGGGTKLCFSAKADVVAETSAPKQGGSQGGQQGGKQQGGQQGGKQQGGQQGGSQGSQQGGKQQGGSQGSQQGAKDPSTRLDFIKWRQTTRTMGSPSPKAGFR